jgi:hypothetical protein
MPDGTHWTRSGAALLLFLLASTASAHGLSDVEAVFRLEPEQARPGDEVSLHVELKELSPGAAREARLEAVLSQGARRQVVPLSTSGGKSFAGRFTLAAGNHDLRIWLLRGERREFAMSGFTVRERLEPLAARDRELFFVPAGRFDAIPWLDHLSGVLAALVGLGAAIRLLRRPRGPTVEVPGKPAWVLVVAALGALLMPFGGYWDITSHMETGRESFFSPPHLLIYGGILLALMAVLAGVGRKPAGRTWRQHLLMDPAAGVAALALVAQLSSGPFDELWHNLFGLDVSVWSPPHAVLILGGMAVCLALSALQVNRGGALVTGLRMTTLAGALLTAGLFLAEFEYPFPSWHVSQARPSAVYVGFLVLFVLLVGLSARRATPLRFSTSFAVALWLGLRLAVYPLLGMLALKVPPAFPPALPAMLLVAVGLDILLSHRARHSSPRTSPPRA